jgi:2,3-dihydroxybenzoate-AMP ligase
VLEGCVPWPDDLAERYRRQGYWRGQALGELLRPWARTDPARVALVAPDRRWTYGELDRRADRLAAGLGALGIRPGDRVVVHLPNGADFVVLCIALFRLGVLPVLALPSHRRVEITHLCRHSDAVAYVLPDVHMGFDCRPLAREVLAACPSVRHVLVAGDPGDPPHEIRTPGYPRRSEEGGAPRFRGDPGEFRALDAVDAEPAPLPPPDAGDAAFFLLSGGTTGTPKLIPRTHEDYAHQLRATANAMGFDERGVYLAALPIAHNAALGCPGVLGALLAGGRAVLAPSPSPDDVFPLVRRERPTLTTLMPSVLTLWLETAPLYEADLTGLVVEVGGAMLPPEVARRVRPALGCRVTHWFGMAEGLLCFTRLDDPEEVAATTQGRPLNDADEIRVVDEQDRDVAPGRVGELLARGPSVLRGYYRAPEHNAHAFTADGFLRTGDLVRTTPEGRLVATGRIKDVVNRGGEKVPVEEVEHHLRQHPAVRDAAVVAVPDRLMGEKTCAFVTAAGEPPALGTLRRFLAERGLADYKLPDRVEHVAALPLTGTGKVDKVALRAEAERRGKQPARP